MVIKRNPRTGKYYIAPSPPSFYKSKPKAPSRSGSSGSKTVPHDFVGPLQPGVTREPAPKVFAGPVRPGTDVETFRRTGRSGPSAPSRTSKPSAPTLIGPVRPKASPSTYTPLSTPKTGAGKFTKAVDVGGGKMQDFVFDFSNGRITNRTPVGRSFVQTKRFKESQERERVARLKLQKRPAPRKKTVLGFSLEKIKKGADITTGGYFTERKLDKKEDVINQDVEKFNKQ